MNTEELGQLIELVFGETMPLEEAASIECVDPRELSRVIDEVMTFRSRHSRCNEIVVLELGSFNPTPII